MSKLTLLKNKIQPSQFEYLCQAIHESGSISSINSNQKTNTLFQQHKRTLYTWISPDGQHQNQIDYILCSQRWRSSIQSAKTRLGADCGSDHELLIAKFRLKLKKVGKTTRPFRYDLNQVPYDYTVEVGFRPDANSIPILSVKWYKFDMNTR